MRLYTDPKTKVTRPLFANDELKQTSYDDPRGPVSGAPTPPIAAERKKKWNASQQLPPDGVTEELPRKASEMQLGHGGGFGLDEQGIADAHGGAGGAARAPLAARLQGTVGVPQAPDSAEQFIRANVNMLSLLGPAAINAMIRDQPSLRCVARVCTASVVPTHRTGAWADAVDAL